MRLDHKTKIERLVIYFFYDADGIVDRYVPYMLEDIVKNCSELFVVCNGKLTPEGRETFKKLTSHILVRENVGFDVWAYKTALEHYGWEKLAEFDEVVLMNYTIFGPLYPFSEMFEKMNKKDVDFWGITKHHKVDIDCFNTCKYKYIPEHIQSNFLVIRQSLIKSEEYHSLWDKMPMINSYAESVGLYEAIFTKDFSDKGFRSDVYIDTSDLEGYTRYPLMMMADELIINRKCPVIKVKSFFQDYSDILGDTVGNCTIDALDYIKKEYSHYNVDFIWEHILRIGNMADIKSIMHLNYILPQTQLLNPDRKSNTRVALVMHLYYPELTKDCLKYAKSMSKKGDLIITVTTKEMKELVEKQIVDLEVSSAARVFLIENRGRDVSALLVGCAKFIMQYDLICFVHDKKTMQTMPFASGRSFAYKCFENNLVSEEYVDNIIDTFEKNPRLGLLTPPPPNHGPLYMTLGSEWASNYDNTVKLAKKLNIRCNIHWSKEPITPLGTMFWFRTKAMKKLFNYGWRYDDFPKEPNGVDGTLLHAIERIYGYVVQDAGYYVAWIMTDRFAKIELTNLSYMLRKKNIACFQVSMQPVCSPGRKKIKLLFKKLVPRKMWEFLRKTYRTWGGKKWVG